MNIEDKKDYICDDTPIEIPERIKIMSDEELEVELKKITLSVLEEKNDL